MFFLKMSLKFGKLHMKVPVPESLFQYSCMLEACDFAVLKRLQHCMVSCGFCQIFKNMQFSEYLQTATSGVHVRSANFIDGLLN